MEQGGAMPVQLPLTSHAIKKEEKEVETESMTDVKGFLFFVLFTLSSSLL